MKEVELTGKNLRQYTVMRFQQFQSTWNKNLPNLNSQDQTIANIKADITS